MSEPPNDPGKGADTVAKSSSQQPQVRWITQLQIALDVAMEQRSPWTSAPYWMTAFALVLIAASFTAVLSGVAPSLVVAAVIIMASLVILLLGPITDRIMSRMHKRAARPDEIAALRIHPRPGTWPMVRNAADDWRRSCTKLPITIAIILR